MTRPQELYGGDAVILSLLQNLNKAKFNSILVCFLDRKIRELPLLLKFAKDIGITVDVVYLKHYFDVIAIFRIRKLLKKYQVNILHCHEYKSDIYGFLATILSRVKKVTTVHGWLGIAKIKKNIKSKIYEYVDATIRRKFDRVIGVSRRLCDLLIKKGCSPNRVKLVYNGLDFERFKVSNSNDDIRKELNLTRDVKIIGAVGRLSEEKGYKYLLEAAVQVIKVFPNTLFVIVGDGPLRDKLLKMASKLNIKNKVIFTGYRRNIIGYISAMDIFVSSSLWEGFGLSLIEAMILGKPVITTNVGIVPEFIENNRTGIVINTKNSIELAEAIKKLLSSEKQLREIAIAGKELVRNKFSAKEMTKKYEDIYIKLVNS